MMGAASELQDMDYGAAAFMLCQAFFSLSVTRGKMTEAEVIEIMTAASETTAVVAKRWPGHLPQLERAQPLLATSVEMFQLLREQTKAGKSH